METRPTVATLILLLIFAMPLFSLLVEVIAIIGRTLEEANPTAILQRLEPESPVKNTTEYTVVANQLSVLETLFENVVSILSNPYSIAVLVAIGILYAVYETHKQ